MPFQLPDGHWIRYVEPSPKVPVSVFEPLQALGAAAAGVAPAAARPPMTRPAARAIPVSLFIRAMCHAPEWSIPAGT